MVKIKFNVLGMTCSSCSSHVEKAVKKLEGVENVNVNLLSNNMIVEYDENKLNNNNIIVAVKEAGYDAKITSSKTIKQQSIDKLNFEENELNKLKKRLLTSIFFLVPLMYLAMYNMIHSFMNVLVPTILYNFLNNKNNLIIYAIVQFILLIPIICINKQYYIVGLKRLIKKSPNMDSLIAIGSGASIIYSIFSTLMIVYGLKINDIVLITRYSNNLYFESAGMILTLITFGKYLEGKSKSKTKQAITKLINLVPKVAVILKDEKEVKVPLEDVNVSDIVIIKPGSNISVDGIVIEGKSFVDEANITGESIPIEKNIGDNVISGTFNKNGFLKIKAQKVGKDTTISQIITLVEEASNSKAPISKLVDKVSGVFVPVVIGISVLSFIIWTLCGQSVEIALNFSIAVLVISCPCALGIATPVAIMVGTSRAAQQGILVKSADVLEELHLVDTVVLDKTGTITKGKVKVTDIVAIENENELLKIAASLEKKSEHPLAEAIIEKANEKNVKLYNVKDFENFTGRGIKAKINKDIYFSGNAKFMCENSINVEKVEKQVLKLLNEGKTCIYFAKNNNIIGIIALQDEIKKTSFKAINELKKRKIDIIMVTGDNKIVAQNVAKKLGITKVISEVLPQEKQQVVLKLKNDGRKVAFVGDGINDSPALVESNVAVAISSGTDIAIESADIVLMKNSLIDVINSIDLSKAIMINIKLNLFWAFIYNIIGIPIAAGVFYNSFGLKLNPMIGALAMSLSSVCVVTNALRLTKFKSKVKEEEKLKYKTKVVYISGMQCNHCKMTVEKVLINILNVESVSVDLEHKCAIVKQIKDVEDEKIVLAIKEAGFEVIKIDKK